MTTEVTYASTTDTTALTITLASLATSSTLLVGRQSTVVDNTSNKYVDVILTGQVTTGTSPTANKAIEVWGFAPLKIASSTKTYPGINSSGGSLGATDAGVTFTASNIKNRLILLGAATNVGTTDTPYAFHVSLATAFGYVPPFWGIFVVHDTAVNLNSTAGNHWFHYQGIKYTDV